MILESISLKKQWDCTYRKFLQGNKNEKLKLLSLVMDIYGFSSSEKEQIEVAHVLTDYMKTLNSKECFQLENTYRHWDYEWDLEKKV